ncbi:MAG: hypothetical protein RLZZ338_287 [Cyanobacteriota bacterium]|jgi:hypothetical protein
MAIISKHLSGFALLLVSRLLHLKHREKPESIALLLPWFFSYLVYQILWKYKRARGGVPGGYLFGKFLVVSL